MPLIPLPLFASAKSGSSTATTEEGETLKISRKGSQINSVRTEGEIKGSLKGEQNYAIEAHHKSGDKYEGTWTKASGTQALPEAVACQAYETVRHLAGTRLEPDQVSDLIDLVSTPLKTPITADTCKGR